MDMNIKEYRQMLIDGLEEEGVYVVDWSNPVFDPPIAYLHPAENFITKSVPTPVGRENCEVTISYVLRVVTGKGDEDKAAAELDSLITKCVRALRHLDEVSVSDVNIATDNDENEYMTAFISFSNTINLEGLT